MKNIYIETYGCQMNEYDTELINTILKDANYELIENLEKAEIIMLNTCSVRDNANRKIINRIATIRKLTGKQVFIGILGCMASNYRKKLFKYDIDFVVGPDNYKNLPQIIEDMETEQHHLQSL